MFLTKRKALCHALCTITLQHVWRPEIIALCIILHPGRHVDSRMVRGRSRILCRHQRRGAGVTCDGHDPRLSFANVPSRDLISTLLLYQATCTLIASAVSCVYDGCKHVSESSIESSSRLYKALSGLHNTDNVCYLDLRCLWS